MKHYLKPIEEVIREFNSSFQGLTNSQVEINKEKYGLNKLPSPKKEK